MNHNTMIKDKIIFLVAFWVPIGWALPTLTPCCTDESFSVAEAAQPLFNWKPSQPLFRKWTTYYSKEHRFKVDFPEGGAPTPVQHSGEQEGAKFSAQGYKLEESDRGWQVLVIGGLMSEFQAKYLTTDARLGAILDSYVDGAMKNTQMRAAGAQLQTKEPARLQDNYPGRHVTVTLDNGVIGEMYVYLVDGIIYQLEFFHAPSAANPSPALDGDLFFRSFYGGGRIPFGAIQLNSSPVQ